MSDQINSAGPVMASQAPSDDLAVNPAQQMQME